MKRLKLLAVLALSVMCANAQIGLTKSMYATWEYLPAEISSNGNGNDYIIAITWPSDEVESGKFDIYDKNFTMVKSIKTDKMEQILNIYSYTYDHHYPLTQTVFNDDEKFEYAVYTDDGFDIYSEDGSTIQSINFKNEIPDLSSYFDWYDVTLYTLKLDDKHYLAAEIGFEENYWTLFYSIGNESTGINNASAPLKLVSVTPRMAQRGEIFTVKLDGNSAAQRTVTVSNMAGQTVWQRTIPAGETEVKISASRLNKGLNVINVSGEGNDGSCKVIVK